MTIGVLIDIDKSLDISTYSPVKNALHTLVQEKTYLQAGHFAYALLNDGGVWCDQVTARRRQKWFQEVFSCELVANLTFADGSLTNAVPNRRDAFFRLRNVCPDSGSSCLDTVCLLAEAVVFHITRSAIAFAPGRGDSWSHHIRELLVSDGGHKYWKEFYRGVNTWITSYLDSDIIPVYGGAVSAGNAFFKKLKKTIANSYPVRDTTQGAFKSKIHGNVDVDLTTIYSGVSIEGKAPSESIVETQVLYQHGQSQVVITELRKESQEPTSLFRVQYSCPRQCLELRGKSFSKRVELCSDCISASTPRNACVRTSDVSEESMDSRLSYGSFNSKDWSLAKLLIDMPNNPLLACFEISNPHKRCISETRVSDIVPTSTVKRCRKAVSARAYSCPWPGQCKVPRSHSFDSSGGLNRHIRGSCYKKKTRPIFGGDHRAQTLAVELYRVMHHSNLTEEQRDALDLHQLDTRKLDRDLLAEAVQCKDLECPCSAPVELYKLTHTLSQEQLNALDINKLTWDTYDAKLLKKAVTCDLINCKCDTTKIADGWIQRMLDAWQVARQPLKSHIGDVVSQILLPSKVMPTVLQIELDPEDALWKF